MKLSRSPMLMEYADGLDGIAFHHHDSAEPMVTVVVALADVERAEEVSTAASCGGGEGGGGEGKGGGGEGGGGSDGEDGEGGGGEGGGGGRGGCDGGADVAAATVTTIFCPAEQ